MSCGFVHSCKQLMTILQYIKQEDAVPGNVEPFPYPLKILSKYGKPWLLIIGQFTNNSICFHRWILSCSSWVISVSAVLDKNK